MKRFTYRYINFRFTYEDFHTIELSGLGRVNLDLNPQFSNPITFDVFMKTVVLEKINEKANCGYELELLDMETIHELYMFFSTMDKEKLDESYPQVEILFKKEIDEF
jgi:hypothetical protein